MPSLLTEAPIHPTTAATAEPPRKRWTREECAAMESVGLDLTRYELVEGDLINKMAKNWPHVIAILWLQSWLVKVFGVPFVVQEGPIDVRPEDNPTNEPIPDLIVLKLTASTFLSCHPKPSDLHLAAEVSDSTLNFDLRTKSALYARAGIAEYWVLDIRARRLIVHREPMEGRYNSVAAYSEGESVSPVAAPAHEFRIADAFAG